MLRSELHQIDATLAPYVAETGDEHQALTNLLSRLIKFCDLVGIDFDDQLVSARQAASPKVSK